MKTINLFLIGLLTIISVKTFGQVGIDTETPKATLDVTAKPTDNTKTDGFIAPRLKGTELKAKDLKYTGDQTGTIVYITESLALAATTTKTANVTATGYYYFDGSVWQKFAFGTASGGTVTASNGLTKSIDDIKLGGTLSEATTIATTSANTLALTGLQNSGPNDHIVTVDVTTGVLKNTSPTLISGVLNKTYYVQGTSTAEAVAGGVAVDVPGVSITHIVPAGKIQTLMFQLTGYANFVNTANGVSGQGVFSIMDGTTKISSAYNTIYYTTNNLVNLPVPVTLLKSITIDNSAGTTPITKTYRATYKAWATMGNGGGNHRVNFNPSNYNGYDGDAEAMLTKMNIAVYNMN